MGSSFAWQLLFGYSEAYYETSVMSQYMFHFGPEVSPHWEELNLL